MYCQTTYIKATIYCSIVTFTDQFSMHFILIIFNVLIAKDQKQYIMYIVFVHLYKYICNLKCLDINCLNVRLSIIRKKRNEVLVCFYL